MTRWTSWSRLLGGRSGQDIIHPADILAALKRTAEREKKYFKERTFVPEGYTVYLTARDLSGLNPILDSLKKELEDETNSYFRQKGLQINSPGVTVDFEERLVMRPGELEVTGRFEKRKESVDLPPHRDEDGQADAPELKIRLLISPGTSREATVLLKEGTHVLGRGRAADVALAGKDPLVSKTHCNLEFNQGAVSVRDLQSANGTILNGRMIANEEQLKSGDRLLLGNTEIQVLW